MGASSAARHRQQAGRVPLTRTFHVPVPEPGYTCCRGLESATCSDTGERVRGGGGEEVDVRRGASSAKRKRCRPISSKREESDGGAGAESESERK